MLGACDLASASDKLHHSRARMMSERAMKMFSLLSSQLKLCSRRYSPGLVNRNTFWKNSLLKQLAYRFEVDKEYASLAFWLMKHDFRYHHRAKRYHCQLYRTSVSVNKTAETTMFYDQKQHRNDRALDGFTLFC